MGVMGWVGVELVAEVMGLVAMGWVAVCSAAGEAMGLVVVGRAEASRAEMVMVAGQATWVETMKATVAGWATWVDWATGAEAGSGSVAGLVRPAAVGWGSVAARAGAMAGPAGWEETAIGKAGAWGPVAQRPLPVVTATAAG